MASAIDTYISDLTSGATSPLQALTSFQSNILATDPISETPIEGPENKDFISIVKSPWDWLSGWFEFGKLSTLIILIGGLLIAFGLWRLVQGTQQIVIKEVKPNGP